MHSDNPILFALNTSRRFGDKISSSLGIPLSEHEEREFSDGEHKSRSLVNVRNKSVFVIQSLYAEQKMSVNDKLCRLLFFIGALQDAAAGPITVVAPYLCYARKDRKTKSRDPVTTRYVAMLMEAVGAGRILTIDVHNLQAYQNAYRCQTEHLEAGSLFVRYFCSFPDVAQMVVLSPDFGGIKRAEQFARSLGVAAGTEIPVAVMEKQRSMDVISGNIRIYGQVKDRTVVIIDDLISSGATLARAAKACQLAGAKQVYAAATHGAFTDQANQVLREKALDQIVITNTVPPLRLEPGLLKKKVKVLDVAPLFAEAIHRIWQGGSLTELLEGKLPDAVYEEIYPW